jgi:hypothetical protein
MQSVVEVYDNLQDEIKDNEGSDIYTEEDLSDWDSTLMDGLEEEKWEDKDLQPVENDWQIVDEEPEIEVKMSGEPSIPPLNEDKILNNPGISSWRKKKLRDYIDGKTKRYF